MGAVGKRASPSFIPRNLQCDGQDSAGAAGERQRRGRSDDGTSGRSIRRAERGERATKTKTRQARRATGARALHAHLHTCPLAGLPLRLALALGHWRRGRWRRRHGQPPRRADQPPTSQRPPAPTHHPSRRRGGVTWRRYAASLFGCPARFSLLLAGTRWAGHEGEGEGDGEGDGLPFLARAGAFATANCYASSRLALARALALALVVVPRQEKAVRGRILPFASWRGSQVMLPAIRRMRGSPPCMLLPAALDRYPTRYNPRYSGLAPRCIHMTRLALLTAHSPMTPARRLPPSTTPFAPSPAPTGARQRMRSPLS
jgi:hypothetical protein